MNGNGRQQYETLFHRSERNPILTAADWPYPVHTVFNAGATMLPDGTTLLLCRVEDRRGLSHLCAARSADGVGGWMIDPEPTLRPDPQNHPEEWWGIEDSRITYVPELGKYAIAYTAFGKGGPGVSLALTEDFVRFERCGLVMQPDDKDAALLPRRVDGMFAFVHRPIADSGAHVWISYSPDLRSWGGHRMMLRARRGGWWDANKVGLSPPLIETERGWLMIYHGVRQNAAGSLYRLGVALFDLEHPERLLLRGRMDLRTGRALRNDRRRRQRHVPLRHYCRSRRRHAQSLLRRGRYLHRHGHGQHPPDPRLARPAGFRRAHSVTAGLVRFTP